MKRQSRQSVAAKQKSTGTAPPDAPAAARGLAAFRWPALLIFAVAALVRLVHVWQISRAPFFTTLMGDARGYDAWANRIAGGEWWGGEVFYQAPLYPYFLGALYSIVGHDLLIVRAVQALVGAASCTLLGLAAARLFDARTGLLAGLALALYAPAIFFDGLIQKSVLDVFFVCLALWLMSRTIVGSGSGSVGSGFPPPLAGTHGERRRDAPERGKREGGSRIFHFSRNGDWLFLGLALGGLALTRENAMVFIAVILVWILFRQSDAAAQVRLKPDPTSVGKVRLRARAIAAFLIGLAIVLVPVAVRNYAVGGGFYITTSQFGPNFYIGNNPKSDGTYMSLRFGRGAPEYERQDAAELAEQALGRPLTPADVSSFWTDRALAFITSEPGRWLRLLGRKFFLLWNADEMLDTESQDSYAEWSVPLRALSWVGHFGVLVPLAVLGIWATWPDRRRLWVLYAMVAAYAASVIMFYVFARYRFPLVPLLTLFAAGGIASVVEMFSVGPVFAQAPAAMPSRGQADPRRGVSVSTRWGWGPSPSEKMSAASAARHGRGRLPVTVLIQAAFLILVIVFTNWPALSGPLMQAITETNLAAAFYDEGQLDRAIAHYQRALALRPDHAPAHNNLGAALRAQGHLGQAIASYQRALAAQPDYADAHYNLANALLDANRPTEAAEHFRTALGAIPDSAGVRNNLGIALANEGRLDEAVAEFRAALQLEPDSAKTNRNLGKALSEMGRTKEGIEYLRRAVALDPGDRDAHYDLGSDLLAINQLPEAEKEISAALAIAPDWAAAHNNLGIVLASMGRLNEAIAEFELALKLQPDFPDAKRNLEIARSQKKR